MLKKHITRYKINLYIYENQVLCLQTRKPSKVNTTNTMFSMPQTFGMTCQAIKILLFKDLTCIGDFFLMFTSIRKQRNWAMAGIQDH